MLFALIGNHSTLRAALLINMVQSGSNVVATVSGSINSWSGATYTGSNSAGVFSGVRPSGGTMIFGMSPLSGVTLLNVLYYSVPIFPTNFGTGGSLIQASSSTASTTLLLRNITNQTIYIDPSYVLGTPMTGTLTWNNHSFASLGVTQGSYLWGWTGDSVTLNIGAVPSPVPEPGTWAAAALLAGTAGFIRWRKRAKI